MVTLTMSVLRRSRNHMTAAYFINFSCNNNRN